MASVSKLFLSGGTADGRGIKVAQTATAGTLIHTAHASAKDEIWLWAINSHTADLLLTIEWGDVSSPDDLIQIVVPFRAGPIRVVPGWILSNSDVVRAFCASANLVMINGFVNRITP